MAAVTALLSLPPEIVLNILDTLSAGEIVTLAQTCSTLRTFILSNRTPLSKTYTRPYTLHLPLGCTARNISSQLLYAHAVKSMATSARLGRSINSAPLQAYQNVVYSLEALGTRWDEQEQPSAFFVRDKILAFLNDQGLFVLLRGASGEIEKHARLDLGPESGYEVAYQLSSDEESLLVVIVSLQTAGDVMQVREICIAKEKFGVLTTHLDIPLPLTMTSCVVIRDPYCVAINPHGAFLVEWRERTGQLLEFYARRADDKGTQSKSTLYDISTILFHPKDSVLVIFDCSEDNPASGMYLADIPLTMDSLTETPRSGASLLRTRKPPEWISPFTPQTGSDPESYEGKMFPMGFRGLSDSSWILDVLVSGDIAEGPDLNADEDPSTLIRLSFDLSDNWTAQVEMIDTTSASPDDTNLFPLGSHRLAGSVFFFRRTRVIAPSLWQNLRMVTVMELVGFNYLFLQTCGLPILSMKLHGRIPVVCDHFQPYSTS
ncbi:hypothetical protein SISNIDRAFT_551145 [Sistotremastrum niveocremeum HHB9708]|uniref:F-box domain-containing protein n=1 Tax=Sistotremastrum niveocremeum HHB9708 TaxID=1314777 RepID=A0A164RYR9_9AGAM|nr:hypothetical protein SISNIDRAFT_551145 [Sistotremastrum niveocremeum HHB9708]